MKLTRFSDLELYGKPVKGSWELLPNHDLWYRAEGRGEEIRFRMPIVAAEPDALVAAWTVEQDDQKVLTRTVRITGRWKTDGKNRIVFEAQRSAGRVDRLTFKGTWKLNDDQEVVYSWAAGRREIVFRGEWKLADRRHLVYTLGGDSESAFRFRGALQTPSILAKKGEVRFQIGAEAAGRARDRRGRRGSRTVALFGAWKVGRDLALSFELERTAARRNVLKFGGDFKIGEPRTLSVNLRSERGKPLGVELVLTREFFKGNGELFARAVRSADESLVEAGGRVRW